MEDSRGRFFSILMLALLSCTPGGPPPSSAQDARTSTPVDAAMSGDGTGSMGAQPGSVSVSYQCDNAMPGMVSLTKEKFGTAFRCTFNEQYVDLRYDDMPDELYNGHKFKLQMKAGYKGPGRYTLVARVIFGGEDPLCAWDTMTVMVPNCPALQNAGGCCDPNRPGDSISCDVTITEHSATKVAGTYACTARRTNNQGMGCVQLGTASTSGSFAYGPGDCK